MDLVLLILVLQELVLWIGLCIMFTLICIYINYKWGYGVHDLEYNKKQK